MTKRRRYKDTQVLHLLRVPRSTGHHAYIPLCKLRTRCLSSERISSFVKKYFPRYIFSASTIRETAQHLRANQPRLFVRLSKRDYTGVYFPFVHRCFLLFFSPATEQPRFRTVTLKKFQCNSTQRGSQPTVMALPFRAV